MLVLVVIRDKTRGVPYGASVVHAAGTECGDAAGTAAPAQMAPWRRGPATASTSTASSEGCTGNAPADRIAISGLLSYLVVRGGVSPPRLDNGLLRPHPAVVVC